MDLLESIHQLPNIEKIKVMEFLWDELTSAKSDYVSPSWHKDALLEAERNLAAGKEEVIDWNEAKRLLRNEFK
jgi:hypothetical protein